MTGEEAFVGLDVHQNNVRSDPPDAFPGDHEIVFSAQNPKESTGTRDDQCPDMAARDLHLHIRHKSKPPAVAQTDDFLALQLRDSGTHTHTSPKRW